MDVDCDDFVASVACEEESVDNVDLEVSAYGGPGDRPGARPGLGSAP